MQNQSSTRNFGIVIIIIAIVAGVYFLWKKPNSQQQSTSYTTAELKNSKSALLDRATSASSKPLTEEEKITLFESLSADNQKKHNFTPEERKIIIGALS